MPSQKANSSLPYTAAPYKLILADLALWFRITFVLPPNGLFSLIFPIGPFNSGPLDELYPSLANYTSLVLQLVFSSIQLAFLGWLIPASFGAVPPFITCYSPIWFFSVLAFAVGNRWASKILLNGTCQRQYSSRVQLTEEEKQRTKRERWIFVNGVAAGEHWMQSNLDRLGLTFRRTILGIHNETRGILFDLIECILERTLGWATPSTRIVYARLLEILSDEQYDRIVLILHSQGAIEGGLALDWLFATLSKDQLSHLEVYTFGSAANHFNNPVYTSVDEEGLHYKIREDGDGRVIKYIEHYANSDDYVSQFGILNYRPIPRTRHNNKLDQEEIQNRYAGRLFVRSGTGHQLNGNYLDNLFQLDETQSEVLHMNPFMEAPIDQNLLQTADIVTPNSLLLDSRAGMQSRQPGSSPVRRRISFNMRVKDVSRLWAYRNGGIPEGTPTSPTLQRDEKDQALKVLHQYDRQKSIEVVPDDRGVASSTMERSDIIKSLQMTSASPGTSEASSDAKGKRRES